MYEMNDINHHNDDNEDSIRKEKNRQAALRYREDKRNKDIKEREKMEKIKEQQRKNRLKLFELEKDLKEMTSDLHLIIEERKLIDHYNSCGSISSNVVTNDYQYHMHAIFDDYSGSNIGLQSSVQIESNHYNYYNEPTPSLDLFSDQNKAIPDLNQIMAYQTEKDLSFFKNVPQEIEYSIDASFSGLKLN